MARAYRPPRLARGVVRQPRAVGAAASAPTCSGRSGGGAPGPARNRTFQFTAAGPVTRSFARASWRWVRVAIRAAEVVPGPAAARRAVVAELAAVVGVEAAVVEAEVVVDAVGEASRPPGITPGAFACVLGARAPCWERRARSPAMMSAALVSLVLLQAAAPQATHGGLAADPRASRACLRRIGPALARESVVRGERPDSAAVRADRCVGMPVRRLERHLLSPHRDRHRRWIAARRGRGPGPAGQQRLGLHAVRVGNVWRWWGQSLLAPHWAGPSRLHLVATGAAADPGRVFHDLQGRNSRPPARGAEGA